MKSDKELKWMSYEQWQFEKQWLECREAKEIRKHLGNNGLFDSILAIRLAQLEEDEKNCIDRC